MNKQTSGRTALLFVSGELPHGDATANRAVCLAKALREAGWSPMLVSERPVASSHNAEGSVDGIPYANVGRHHSRRLGRLLERFRRPQRLERYLDDVGMGDAGVQLLIVHAAVYGQRLQRWADARSIVVIADLMESHEPHQFAQGRLDPRYLRHRRLSRLCARRPNGLFLISEHLRSVVEPRVPCIVVPPFADTRELGGAQTLIERDPEVIALAYAGVPSGKDLLGPMIEAIAALEPGLRARVQFTIAGPTRDALVATTDVKESSLLKCGAAVNVVGRLGRDQVRELWQSSDFCVLLRPTSQYAIAGFPSKVPEAMSAGCALLGTPQGDLVQHVHDGVDSIHCRSVEVKDVAAALHRALGLSRQELDLLREAARTEARRSLTVSAWAPRLDAFLATL